MRDSMQNYIAQLGSTQAAALRESTCSALAEALAATGAVLWAFGLADQPRRAIAVAIQMAGETARGAVLLLRDNNRYGGAALVRQIVEIEYLLCLFALDRGEPVRWASSDLEAVRKEYQPARMRERCGDRFRSAEYFSHCLGRGASKVRRGLRSSGARTDRSVIRGGHIRSRVGRPCATSSSSVALGRRDPSDV
jgi:hypothetical protein